MKNKSKTSKYPRIFQVFGFAPKILDDLHVFSECVCLLKTINNQFGRGQRCETRSRWSLRVMQCCDACIGRSSWDRRRRSSITCWDAQQQRLVNGACTPDKVFKLRLGKVHSPRLRFDSPAPHSRQRETHLFRSEASREMDEGSSIGKRFQTELEVRRKFRIDCEKEKQVSWRQRWSWRGWRSSWRMIWEMRHWECRRRTKTSSWRVCHNSSRWPSTRRCWCNFFLWADSGRAHRRHRKLRAGDELAGVASGSQQSCCGWKASCGGEGRVMNIVEMRQTRADHPGADQDPSEPETNRCQNCERRGSRRQPWVDREERLMRRSQAQGSTRHAYRSISASVSESRSAHWPWGTWPPQQRLRKEWERSCRALLRSRDDPALAGVHPSGQSRTATWARRRSKQRGAVLSPRSHAQHVEERAWANSSPQSSSWSTMRTSCRARRTDENNEKSQQLSRAPGRNEKNGPTAGENKSESARRWALDRNSPMLQRDQHFDGETVENNISHSTVQGVRGQNKTHLRDVTSMKEQTIRSTLPTAAIKTSLRMWKKTVEVPQMHDIDKIVRRCFAETEEGQKRPKRMNPWQRGLRKRIQCSSSTDSWTYQ